MNTETFHFKTGDFDCIAINDGYITHIRAHEFFADAPLYDLQMAFDRHDIQPGPLPIPITVLYINTGQHQVLIDTGTGRHTDNDLTGHLVSRLRFEGIAPEDIDTVILSHGHSEHLGGCIQPNGALTFPNARYAIDRREYTYWITHPQAAPTPIPYTILTRIREQVDLLEPDAVIVPGIQAIQAPGHTPGHCTYRISSSNQTLYCLTDIVDHAIHFEYPTWCAEWEMDKAQLMATRQALFTRIYREQALLHAMHLPFPGVGSLGELGVNWRYLPVGI